MQLLPVTKTKVLPPRHRPDLLSRPRLQRVLQSFADRQLVLIIAPAGYGKTTALIDYVHSIDMPACWYAVAVADRNIHRFVAHFIAAIAQQFPDFGEDSNSALQNLESGRINIDQLLTILINELYDRVDKRFTFVIDDYHLVDDHEEIGAFVSQFLQYAGDHCQIIIASRTLLTLPDLALLVAHGAVDGLDFEELAFQRDELQALAVQNYNQFINDKDAEDMILSTEGWITGLLLSANTKQLHLPSRMRLLRSSGIDLYSYLATQVLNNLAPQLRTFLLRTSYMEEFDAELCTQVFDPTWRPDGESWQSLIDRILHENLFVSSVGDQGESVRYHHLFQDFLQRRLQSERTEDVLVILRRLIDVFLEKQQWEQAYLYAERLGEQSAIAELISTAGLSMIYAGRTLLLQEWLEKMPSSVMRMQPKLLWLSGYCNILLGQVDQGIKRLNDAERLLSKAKPSTLMAQVFAHRSIGHRFQGSYQLSLDDADAAIHQLDKLAPPSRQNGYYGPNNQDAYFGGYKERDYQNRQTDEGEPEESEETKEYWRIKALAYRSKGLGLCMQGNLNEGLKWQQRSLELYQQSGDIQNVATVSMEIAITYDNTGQKSLAQPLFLDALEAWREQHNLMGQANVLNSLGVSYQEQGEYRLAFTTLAQAIECARRSGYARMEAFALTSLGDLLFEVALLQAAQAFYQEAYMLVRRLDERFLMLYLELARAALAWSASEWSTAYDSLDAAGGLVLSKSSSYEWGLYRQAMGRYYMAQGLYKQAIEPLQDAATCFAQGGQTTDETKTRLMLAVSCQALDKSIEAANEFENALKLLAQLDTQHAIVVTASQLVEYLTAITVRGPQKSNRLQLLSAVESFQNQRSLLRGEFRQQLPPLFPHIPVDPPALTMRALGRADVSINGRAIALKDWKTRVSRDLLFSLLEYPDGLTKEQIGLLFWPDTSAENLKTRFKNAIYRMRSALEQEVILFEDNIYRFDTTLDYEYDVEVMLYHLELGDKASEPSVKIEAYTQALEQYGGPFLPDAEANWVYAKRERLRQLYQDTALQLAELHFEFGSKDTALEWCQRVLDEDPCVEEAHRLAMRIYASTGNRAGVARQYSLCQKALEEEFDAPPSPQTEELYAFLMR